MIRYKVVDSHHPISKGLFTSLLRNHTFTKEEVNTFRRDCGLQYSKMEHSILALEGTRLVGFFRFTIVDGRLYACGTFVKPSYRSQGIAQKMWETAFQVEPINFVDVPVGSVAGKKFIERMASLYRNIKFSPCYSVDDSGSIVFKDTLCN